MTDRALLVVNVAAGQRTAGDGDLAACVALLESSGFELTVRETGAGRPTAGELARQAADDRVDAVIVAGGDGTVQSAAAALLERDVALGILPFGSFMNIANGLAIPLRPIEAAQVIASRRTKRCDVGEVAGRIFFETCGIGLDADAFGAARLIERRRWRRALRRIVRWATARTRRIDVAVDGVGRSYDLLQLLVVNCPYYAWALPLVPEADMTDGMLDVALFERMGRIALLRSLFEIWRHGRPGVPPTMLRGAEITISADRPMPVHADNQIAGTLPVTVRCRVGALRVFA